MKPFVVFQSAEREAVALRKNFRHFCVVASSSNGWMNEELTLLYLKRVIGSFFFFPKEAFGYRHF